MNHYSFEQCLDSALDCENLHVWGQRDPSAFVCAKMNDWLSMCHFYQNRKTYTFISSNRLPDPMMCIVDARTYKCPKMWRLYKPETFSRAIEMDWMIGCINASKKQG